MLGARGKGIQDAEIRELARLSERHSLRPPPLLRPLGSRHLMQDRYAEVNGLRIHYVDWGTSGKQPLVLLHGIARVARTFDHLAPHFTSDYHVIAIDLRGHGDSGWAA